LVLTLIIFLANNLLSKISKSVGIEKA
jgi:hypothetical protein